TFSGNSAYDGGAISFTSGGSLMVENSTLSGNSSYSGGGIFFYGTGGAGITIRNSTITANKSAGARGGIDRGSGPALVLDSSIVSGNSGGYPDIGSPGVNVTANFSAVGSNTGFPALDGTGNLPFGADLKLGPLADNGGPTQTHVLLAGSP